MKSIILALVALIQRVMPTGRPLAAFIAIVSVLNVYVYATIWQTVHAQNPGAPVSTRVPQPAVATAIPAPLLHQSDLVYMGAFRLPPGASGPIAYRPDKGTLLAVTTSQFVTEVTIPEARTGALKTLALATEVQPATDVLAGKRPTGGLSTGFVLGGLLPWGDRLIVSGYIPYDGLGREQRSHFLTGLDFSHLPSVLGPLPVGALGGGFVGGYMALIPAEWRTALGGPALTGLCCISITSRTSSGPSVSVFSPEQVGRAGNLSPLLLGYPLAHQTLGDCAGKGIYNCATQIGGIVFPVGTRSVLFFGRLGQPECYGKGTPDKALNGKPYSAGTIYCYDPTDSAKGRHAFPYSSFVWAYDANDLAAVKAWKLKPWAVKPYATWSFDLPMQASSAKIRGVAFDPATRRIYLSVDGPLVHVFALR